MDAYKNGIIDKQEVLKKTEVFDMEGVLQRTDIIAQLESKLKQAGEQIKSLKGDLQTRDREAVNLRKKVEVEKFKSNLDGTAHKAKAAATVFEKRLGDEMTGLKREVALATKDSATPSNGVKGR
jgi:regulator of replication initiation timing